MRILLVSTSSGSRGGGEIGLLYLGKALSARGHEVILWAADHQRMDELAARFAVFGRVVRAPYVNTYDRRWRSLGSYFDTATARRVAAEWRALSPDVVHVNKQNLEDGLDLLNAAARSGLPCLAMIHITQSAAYLRAQLARVRDFFARRALQRFPGLLVTTPESRRQDLTQFIGESSRVRVVLNGVPLPDLTALRSARAEQRRTLRIADEEVLFLGVGRMEPQKRPRLWLETAERVCATWPEARFLWVGDGSWSAEWDAWVAQKQLGDKIRRLPWQEDAALLLGAADAFVHVAEFEGLAFAILEALAAGLPCGLSPNLLVEMPFLTPDNSVAITNDDAWLQALRSVTGRAALGGCARQLAETQFSFASMAEHYETLYREVAAVPL